MTVLKCSECRKFVPGSNLDEAQELFNIVATRTDIDKLNLPKEEETAIISELVIGTRTCSAQKASICGARCVVPKEYIPIKIS